MDFLEFMKQLSMQNATNTLSQARQKDAAFQAQLDAGRRTQAEQQGQMARQPMQAAMNPGPAPDAEATARFRHRQADMAGQYADIRRQSGPGAEANARAGIANDERYGNAGQATHASMDAKGQLNPNINYPAAPSPQAVPMPDSGGQSVADAAVHPLVPHLLAAAAAAQDQLRYGRSYQGQDRNGTGPELQAGIAADRVLPRHAADALYESLLGARYPTSPDMVDTEAVDALRSLRPGRGNATH